MNANLRRNWAATLAVFVTGPLIVGGANVPVDIVNFSFQPATVSIQVGDTVTWTQKDATQHTSTSDTAIWNSPFLSVGQTFARTFDTAGTYPYHCSPHPFMKASVSVQGAAVNQPPTISITSPASGATLTDPNVTIEATASDPDGSIAQVQFFDRRTLLGVVTSPPYKITVPLAVGTHNLSAQATDDRGAFGGSTPVGITVSAPANVPPTVSITQPSDGQSFVGPVTVNLEAQANDPDGSIAKVEFMANGNLLGSVTSAPFTFTWDNVAPGTFTITAVATDNSGASTTSSAVHLTVSSAVPPSQPRISSAVRTADQKLQIIVTGTDGHGFLLQGSGDLRTWNTVQTIDASSATQPIVITPPPGPGSQFYRVQLQ